MDEVREMSLNIPLDSFGGCWYTSNEAGYQRSGSYSKHSETIMNHRLFFNLQIVRQHYNSISSTI